MKKNRHSPAVKKKIFRLNKAVIILAVVALSFVLASLFSYRKIKKMDFFSVKEIILREDGRVLPQGGNEFSYLKGANIFDIDMKKESAFIAGSYPSCKKIRIVKYLPDKLFIDFLKRKPLAYIKSNNIFFIDEDLVLFDMEKGQQVPLVPEIIGVGKKVSTVRCGTKMQTPDFATAWKLIRQMQANKSLRDYRVIKVDVSKPSDASIFLLVPFGMSDYTNLKKSYSRELEVRIGDEDISYRIGILASVIGQVTRQLVDIEYVDLRFKEPVIKFKNSGRKSQ